MLLLDEPAAGMNPVETHEITELISRLREEAGYTILVIEHDMHVVEGISDRVVALDHGVKIAEGSFEARRDERARRRGLPRPEARRRRSERERRAAAAAAADRRSTPTTGRSTSCRGSRCTSAPGELVCLLGGNASGKSTTLKTILGIVEPRRGTVEFAGEDVTKTADELPDPQGHGDRAREPAAVRADDGAREPEDGRLPARAAATPEDYERVYTLFPRVYERRDQLAGTLSGGEQQMVAMGRALMSHPKLLLMDEPSMGLAPILVEKSFEIIKQVNDEGVAVLVVEQNANVSLSIADRGYVLSTGRVVLEGAAGDLIENDDLRKAYLGR